MKPNLLTYLEKWGKTNTTIPYDLAQRTLGYPTKRGLKIAISKAVKETLLEVEYREDTFKIYRKFKPQTSDILNDVIVESMSSKESKWTWFWVGLFVLGLTALVVAWFGAIG